MLFRGLIGTIAIAALLPSITAVQAFDGGKYPDLSGQWRAVRPPGVTGQALADRLKGFGNVEVLRTYAQRDAISPPVAVVRMSDDAAAALRRSAAGTLIIAASFHRSMPISTSVQHTSEGNGPARPTRPGTGAPPD